MDGKFLLLVGLLFMTIFTFSSSVLFEDSFVTFTRADTQVPDGSKSIIYVWPMKIKTKDEKAQIKVFARSKEGRALSNKVIELSLTNGKVEGNNIIQTNKMGIATYQFFCDNDGISEISATINSIPVSRSITVECFSE